MVRIVTWCTAASAISMSGSVKVFGCRPLTEGWRAHGRPASENLQGRKPRERETRVVGRALWGFECRCAELCGQLCGLTGQSDIRPSAVTAGREPANKASAFAASWHGRCHEVSILIIGPVG